MSLKLLSPTDRSVFTALDVDSRTEVRRRLAAIAKIDAARPGTKNAVMTTLADSLGVSIGTLASFRQLFHKSGIKAITPRRKSATVPQPSLTR